MSRSTCKECTYFLKGRLKNFCELKEKVVHLTDRPCEDFRVDVVHQPIALRVLSVFKKFTLAGSRVLAPFEAVRRVDVDHFEVAFRPWRQSGWYVGVVKCGRFREWYHVDELEGKGWVFGPAVE